MPSRDASGLDMTETRQGLAILAAAYFEWLLYPRLAPCGTPPAGVVGIGRMRYVPTVFIDRQSMPATLINFRASEVDRQILRAAAAARGTTVSQMIRSALAAQGVPIRCR